MPKALPLRMKTEPRKNLNSYARYSGIAIQMLVIICLGVFGGWKLDQWLDTSPLFTVVLSLGAVIISIYHAVKDLLKK